MVFVNVYGYKENISRDEYEERVSLYTKPPISKHTPEKYRELVKKYNRPEFRFVNAGVLLDYCISVHMSLITNNFINGVKREIDWKKYNTKFTSAYISGCEGCPKAKTNNTTTTGDSKIGIKD